MRKLFRYGLWALLVLLIAAVTYSFFYARTLGPRLKNRVVSALADRFDADVQLDGLQIALFPSPSVTGEGLAIRHKQWADPHPLIFIRKFYAETDFFTVFDRRNRVNLVRLEGLQIHLPPRGRSTLIAKKEANQDVASGAPGQDTTQLRFVIQTIVADGALLEIEPKQAGKNPLQFQIEKLIMHSVGPGQAMTFTAKVANARPPGLIDSSGHFGPWQRDDPRATHVDGDYTFQNADLSVFKGIGGVLSSSGKYGGVLQHIEVDGVTDTPAFTLKHGGDPVPLTTRFHAAVDGMNGDTILDPVDAKFLHSEFICTGGVVHLSGPQGKTVQLDAFTKSARLEDILQLVLGGKPVLKGDVNFRSKITIPPGQEEVINKLALDGAFSLLSATFTSAMAEQRLRTLSDRAQGVTKAEEQEGEGERGTVASNLRARFVLANGVATFRDLSFQVPGAQIQLAGSYGLRSEKVDMQGHFRMHATLSETQSGLKHWALKPFDSFFKKDGAGFEVPIEITGTRGKPEIGASAFHRKFTIH